MFAGFGRVLARSEARSVDAQLQASLRSVVAAYDREVASTQQLADRYAAGPRVADALRRRDLPELERLAAAAPRVRIESGPLRAGPVLPQAVERTAAVLGPDGRTVGRVVASLPLDSGLPGRLAEAAGLRDGQRVEVGRRLSLQLERPYDVSLGEGEFRALAAALPADRGGVEIAVMSPREWITSAQRSVWLRLLAALIVSLWLVALVAYLIGRSIVDALRRLVAASRALAAGRLDERVAVSGSDEFAQLGKAFNEMAEQLEGRLEDLAEERRRLRTATVRFGEALASTHDPEHLLRAIAEAAVDATRATGGEVIGSDGRVVDVGDPHAGPARVKLPLQAGGTSFGSLVLRGPEFTIQDVESASFLVGHAVVALENARLHRILERQALVDSLTGLANRRAAERALGSEVSRSLRYGPPVAIILADLDGFKEVNDRHGHPVGDLVLREFGSVLQSTVREVDVVARWGGEEFCVLVPGTDAEGAARLAERIRTAIEKRTILTGEGTTVRVTASFGVAALPPFNSPGDLVSAADAALYAAKREGKNRVSVGGAPVSA